LLYQIIPIDAFKYKQQYRSFVKQIYEKYDDDRPHKDIKYQDSVFNSGRILGAVGTYQHKYKEKPLRKILFMNINVKNQNDIEPFIKDIKVIKPRMLKDSDITLIADKYDETTIYQSPEFQLLKQFNDLPEGKLHTSIIFSLKLLMKINGLTNQDEMKTELEDLGYVNKDMEVPEGDYEYNQRTLVKWCMEEFEWCADNDYSCPYIIFPKKKLKESQKVSTEHEEIEVYMNQTIETPFGLLEYIRNFNSDIFDRQKMEAESFDENPVYTYHTDSLRKHLEHSIKNPKLKKFVFELKHASSRVDKKGEYEKDTLFDCVKFYLRKND
jgi:hypothetical protein